MNSIEKLCYFLQIEMEEPQAFGKFHLLCLSITFVTILCLYFLRNKYNERQLKFVIGIYGIVTLILEILKQLIYSFNYDIVNNIINWDYPWYIFPFQLCTTPMYVTIICLFLKKSNLRTSLFSYLSFITIWGSIMTALMPDSCFVSTILVNIHTTWLHFGSLVVSIYLLMNKEVEIKRKNIINSILVLIIFIIIANVLNIFIYQSNILNGETFNMFYISPYFDSSLPIFVDIQKLVPYPIFLFIYIFALSLGAIFIYMIAKYKKYSIKENIINFYKKILSTTHKL